jgi:sensor histidine kinase YesM
MIQRCGLQKCFSNKIHKQAFSRYQIIVSMGHHSFKAFIHRINYFIQSNKKTIKTHTIGWSVFWIVDFCFAYANTNGNVSLKNVTGPIFFTLSFYLIFYFSFLPNLPKFKLKAILSTFIVLLFVLILKYILDHFILGYHSSKSLPSYISFEVWRLSNATFYTLAYWIYIQNLKEQKLRYLAEIKLIETEETLLKTEIKFLKAQINPHFLFNTLNFLYAETYKLSPKLSEGILMLTDIMRYTVQSTQNEEIPIEKEAEFLRKYVQIQQLRFHNTLQVVLEVNIFSPNLAIPPLIILSFVENAFKYGKLNDATNPLIIRLESNPKIIHFYCKNLINTHFKDPSTAVGIDNIKTRLDKHCPDYNLAINNENGFYEVNLQINRLP